MARPKLPTAQRKAVTITVRMRLDQVEGLTAVAALRRTTRSGLISQFAAEQIRLEQERDRSGFDASVDDVRFQRGAEQRKRSAQTSFERPSCSPDSLKATTDHHPTSTLPCVESRPHDRSIEALYNTRETVIQIARGGPSLIAHRMRTTCGTADAHSNEINLAREHPE